MRRSMSRTPPVARHRRSATPVRLSNGANSAGRSPPPACLELHRLPSRSVSPIGTRLISHSVPASASLVLPSVSQITAPDLLPPVKDVENCALCQTELNVAMPVWQWPCRCRVRLHLSCMVQLRMRADAPACVRCRDPWPGAVADAQLVARCQQELVPIQNSWEDLPNQPERDLCDGMPGRPDHILALCCARMSAWDAPLHAREMEWSPNRVFQVNTDGARIQTGWQEEWGCNICGKTLLQNDPLIGNALASAGAEAMCPSDGHRTLVIDLTHGSRNCVCLPGCTHSLPVPETSVPGCIDTTATMNHQSNLFSAMPPTANNEDTHSSFTAHYFCKHQAFCILTQLEVGVWGFPGLNHLVRAP